MPVYEWQCFWCNDERKIERVEKMNENLEPPFCPACGGRTTKVPSVSNPQFKGSGWTPNFGGR